MTRQLLVPLTILATSIAALAAPQNASPAPGQLSVYRKNLARQHVGANLFIFNSGTQSYTTSEAAAAWLDDDVTTGWPIMAGKQHYLLALPEPDVMSNFAMSTRSTAGTVTLFAGDEPAAPGAKSWTPLAKNVPLESVNQKKLAKSFSRFAKYLLIETDIADPGPLFSLYLYGERPATSYVLAKRDKTIDTKSIFGYVNDQTAMSHSSLALGSRVTYAASSGGNVAWQKAIDDNPETSVAIAASATKSGLVLKFNETPEISRISVLTGSATRGQLDFFLIDSAPADAEAVPLTGLTPTISMAFDGSSASQAMDFPATRAGALLVRWVPEAGNEPLAIRELNAFNGLSLSEYALGMTPEAVAELVQNGDVSKDGKSFKDGKAAPEAVGDILPQSRGAYLPGALGFPPNLSGRIPPPLPPESSP